MNPGAFRFLLATLVVLSHYTKIGIGTGAVYIFFALSGYWVYQMWTAKYSATTSPYVTYLVSRVWRLAPVFLLCSGAGLFLVWIAPLIAAPAVPFAPVSNAAAVSSLILLGYSNIPMGAAPLVPAWSLDVEMQFYIAAPALMTMFAHRPRTVFLGVLLAMFVGLALWRDHGLLRYLPFFMVGVAAARFPSLKLSPKFSTISAVASVGMVVVLMIFQPLRGVLIPIPDHAAMFGHNAAFNVILAVFALPFALSTVTHESGRIDRFMSDASYSLYLLHWIPFSFIDHYMPVTNNEGTTMTVFMNGLALFITYALSAAITRWIDRPLDRMRTAFVRRRGRQTQLTTAAMPTAAKGA
jgi:peptidoglycan/LPS O-acetylase OafA/YrhL